MQNSFGISLYLHPPAGFVSCATPACCSCSASWAASAARGVLWLGWVARTARAWGLELLLLAVAECLGVCVCVWAMLVRGTAAQSVYRMERMFPRGINYVLELQVPFRAPFPFSGRPMNRSAF